MKRLIIAVTLLLVAGTAFAAQAFAPLKLGILAIRPKLQEMVRWQPLATYLETALAHPVELTLYDHAELNAAAAQRQVDVVLTASGHFILLQQTSGLSAPLATLVSREGPHKLSAFGGVILTRADRNDITSLADLAGKRIAAVSIEGLGGYQMQAF